jgi:predicted metal-dependent hydrolase
VIDRPAAEGLGDPGEAPVARPGTVLQGGRAKAYRPLPAETRRQAYDRALEAYDRGDFFLTHELLEPAWMGTDDPAERALHQGLIKLAAAFVHGVRGNPKGIVRNLVGARERLADAVGTPAAADSGLDLAALLDAIDDRLARLAADPTDASIDAPDLPRISR